MPTSLPQSSSIVARWSADDITGLSNNALVSTWTDSVGGAAATQGTSGLQPTYTTNRLNGLPSVKFPGTAVLQIGRPTSLVTALDSQICSVMIVSRTLGSVSNGALFGASAGGNSQFWQATGTNVGRFNTMLAPHSGQTSFMTQMSTSVKPYTLGSGTGLERLYINGGCGTSYIAEMPTSGGNNYAIGALTGGSFKVNAEIFDIIVWSVCLTTAEAMNAHKWACDKYGQDYPWKTTPAFFLFDGDSITAGVGGIDITGSYPYKVAQTLGLSYGQWHNLGIGGITANNNNVKAPVEIDSVQAITDKYVKLCFFEWFNQKAADPGPANNTYAYCDARRSVAKTQLVLGSSTDTNATTDANRAAYNANLDTNHAAHSDAYVPLHTDPNIGVETAYADGSATYFSDGVHLKAAGYTVMAGLFVTGLQALSVLYSVTGGSASVQKGSATSAYTVSLSTAATAGQTITLTASAGTVTVTAAGATITGNNTGTVQVSMPAGMFEFTFTYTGGGSGSQTVSFTNGQSWSNPTAVSVTVTASSYTFTGPTAGNVGSESSDFTITPDSSYTGTITPSDGGAGGTFTPSSLSWSSSTTAKTFTYRAASAGSVTISATASPSLTNSSGTISFTATETGTPNRVVSGPVANSRERLKPAITFQVSLTKDAGPSSLLETVDAFLYRESLKTIYLPGMDGPVKNGEVFTIWGREAAYLKLHHAQGPNAPLTIVSEN